MPATVNLIEAERNSVDHAALRLMLSYVEAECLRMGATDAARHAALAASLVPVPPASDHGGAGAAHRSDAALH